MRSKPALQRRSEEKRERILAAMESLLLTRSFDDIGIYDLAEQAGVSPATIYQRFRNTDAAGAVLLELYIQRVKDWAMRPKDDTSRSAPGNLYHALLTIGRDAWDQVEALGHVMRPAYIYSRRKPNLAGDDWARAAEMATEGFRAFLDRHAEYVGIDDLDRAAGTICFVVNMLTAGLLLHGKEASLPFLRDRETFARELADLTYRYLNPYNPDRR